MICFIVRSNVDDCKKAWKKFNNWLTPIPIRVIFEEIGKGDSYFFAHYEWTSHIVHLSPLSTHFSHMEMTDFTFTEFVEETVLYHVTTLLRAMTPMTTNSAPVRRLHARLLLLDLYRMAQGAPDRLKRLCIRSKRHRLAIGEVQRENFDLERFTTMLIGAEPEDPLVIKV